MKRLGWFRFPCPELTSHISCWSDAHSLLNNLRLQPLKFKTEPENKSLEKEIPFGTLILGFGGVKRPVFRGRVLQGPSCALPFHPCLIQSTMQPLCPNKNQQTWKKRQRNTYLGFQECQYKAIAFLALLPDQTCRALISAMVPSAEPCSHQIQSADVAFAHHILGHTWWSRKDMTKWQKGHLAYLHQEDTVPVLGSFER